MAPLIAPERPFPKAAVRERQRLVNTGNPMHINLYDFENTAVAETAPADGLSGTVVRRVALEDWGNNWLQ